MGIVTGQRFICAPELICLFFLLMTLDHSDISVLIGGWIRRQRLAGDQAHRGSFEKVCALGGDADAPGLLL